MLNNAKEVFFPNDLPYNGKYDLGSFHSAIFAASNEIWNAFIRADSSNSRILCERFNVSSEFIIFLYNKCPMSFCVPSIALLLMNNNYEHIWNYLEEIMGAKS